jgi:ABC-type sugar transport system substrate-binding protein
MPFQRAQAQFLNLLDAQDADHELSMQDARGNSSRQLSQIESLLSAPPAILLLQPTDFPSLTSLAALKNAGTRIILVDPPSKVNPSSEIEAIFACDPKEIGRAAAKIALNALSKRARDQGDPIPKGRILEIRGANDSAWSSEVHAGFAECLPLNTSITLVHDAPADWTSANVQPRYAEALRLQKSIDVVFAHDDFLAQAAHFAATAAGTRDDTLIIGINGFAGAEGGLEMMRRNEIDATIQRPFLVDTAWQHFKQPPNSASTTEVQVKPRAIVPSDLDQSELLDSNQAGTPADK